MPHSFPTRRPSDLGGVGVTERVLSSAHLSKLLRMRAPAGEFDIPQSSAFSHMLTRLGYSKVEKQVKWRGEPLRVWLKNGVELDNDQIRSQLDLTLPALLPAPAGL